ncbi:hypothetical protein CC78DRAFT_549479 [Lojkania enalia]|uniref:SHSP domain-containing protein n=1 Tax=Lojkania enalia TaxID=147567 RepID=A0A9P4MX91_9PLEO|nr:hypothetical protein CC78DRAFT_549479 [Didymosphaeria enalia]
MPPNFNIDECPSAYFVKSYLPGCHENDVSIRWLNNQALEIEGFNPQDSSGWRPVSGSTGRISDQVPVGGERERFTQRFQFPTQVRREGLKARMDDSILEVMVPKAGTELVPNGEQGARQSGPELGAKI